MILTISSIFPAFQINKENWVHDDDEEEDYLSLPEVPRFAPVPPVLTPIQGDAEDSSQEVKGDVWGSVHVASRDF